MNVNGNNYPKPSGWSKYMNKLLSKIKSVELGEKAQKTLEWTNKQISSPEQRLILGVTALATQPYIEGHNKRVDRKTKKVAIARTVSKIIAGTLVGVCVRKASIKAISKYSDYTTKNISDALTKQGEKIVEGLKADKNSLFTPSKMENCTLQKIANYRNAIGTYLGLVISLFTNLLIDAPLTNILSNYFSKQINEADDKKNTRKGGKIYA